MRYDHNFMPLLNLEAVLESDKFDAYFQDVKPKDVFTGFLH